MTWNPGYAIRTGIFIVFFLATATAQIAASRLHRFLYWAVIVATTMAGTKAETFTG